MVRFSIVFSVVGMIMQGFALVMLIPLLVAMLCGQSNSIFAFSLCIAISFVVGQAAWRCNKSRNFDDLTRVEGMGAVTLSWLSVAILGAIPFMCFNLSFIDSLFESMSGFTTTGATILQDFSVLNSSMFFYRGYTQWLGGVGILVLFVAILPHLSISGRQLFFAETSSASKEKLTPRISGTARQLWSWYFLVTLLETALLYFYGMPLIDAFSNSFTTMAAGGFSPHPQSIMGYKSAAIEWIITFFMFVAGANFALQVKSIRGHYSSLLKNREFHWYVIIIAVSSLILSLQLWCAHNGTSLIDSIRTALFQNLSIMTTTGFASVDFDKWQDAAKIVLFVLMFIGGCSGSAGGGIKVIRFVIVIKYLGKMLLKAIYPSAIINIKFEKQVFKEAEIQPVLAFVTLYFLLFALAGSVTSIIENDMIIGYSGTIATLGNIGPGFKSIGPMGSFGTLHTSSKAIYVIMMWAGRLELMSLLAFLRKEVWRDSSWQ